MRRPLLRVSVAILVIVVAVAGYLRFVATRTPATSTPTTTSVQRGSLAATVNAAGNITARQEASLSFGQSGTVGKINVQAGDRVKAGDVLAELEAADLALQVRNAEVSYKIAQAQFAQTKNPATERDIANARAKLASAQAAYDKVAAGPSEADLAVAQAQLASAQASYDAAVKSAAASNSSLTSATAAYEKARIALETAQASYDKVAWRGDVGASSQAQELQSATIDYEQAKANYDAAVATASSDANSKVASALSSLQQARANLESLKSQVTEADLASAQATLTQARNDLDALLAGPDAYELDIAQSQLEQSQISLEQARLKLDQARIVAPFDGVVTDVSAGLGQSSSGAAIQIADLDHLEIIVQMAEVDVNRVQPGQKTEITLDALPDVTLAGTVAAVAPAGVQSQGVVNYPVTVALDGASEGVKTGMTANLNIIIEQKDDVLLVPNRALRSQGRQRIVTVLFEGQQFQTPVQTGLSSYTMTEIVSGLREGDEVVLSSTTATASGSMRGMGAVVPGGLGGGPMGR